MRVLSEWAKQTIELHQRHDARSVTIGKPTRLAAPSEHLPPVAADVDAVAFVTARQIRQLVERVNLQAAAVVLHKQACAQKERREHSEHETLRKTKQNEPRFECRSGVWR